MPQVHVPVWRIPARNKMQDLPADLKAHQAEITDCLGGWPPGKEWAFGKYLLNEFLR